MPKLEDVKVRKCATCGERKSCTYTSDPFDDEINGDDTPAWYCDECLHDSAMEI